MIYYIGVALLLIVIGLSYYISRVVFFPKIPTYEEALQWEVEHDYYNEDDYKKYEYEEVSIQNDGLKLVGHYLNNHSDKTLIFAHGYTSSHHGAYKYLTPYLENNFNILMFDQRAHGHSEGKNPTLGYKEHKDFIKWIEFINAKTPNLKVLGCHGESMGAATVLLAGHHESLAFVISDCGFSTFKKQVEYHLWHFNKIPKFMVYPTSLLSRILWGAPILPVRPMDNVKSIKAPLLVIHGNQDTYVPIDHFYDIKAQLQKKDSFYVAEGAKHAESYRSNREKYDEVVRAFLKENNII